MTNLTAPDLWLGTGYWLESAVVWNFYVEQVYFEHSGAHQRYVHVSVVTLQWDCV